jgi:hypothetical protein
MFHNESSKLPNVVTAYGDAVRRGLVRSYEEWLALIASHVNLRVRVVNGNVEIWDTESQSWKIVTVGGSGDHRQLSNRDANDQHPIAAISGLGDELAGKYGADTLVAVTDTEIDAMLNL